MPHAIERQQHVETGRQFTMLDKMVAAGNA